MNIPRSKGETARQTSIHLETVSNKNTQNNKKEKEPWKTKKRINVSKDFGRNPTLGRTTMPLVFINT